MWALLCAAERIQCTDTEIIATKGYVTAGYKYADSDMQYPDYMQVVNQLISQTPTETKVIGFDPVYTEILRKVFGKREMYMKLYGPDKGMVVYPDHAGKQYAILMPKTIGLHEVFNFNIEGERSA